MRLDPIEAVPAPDGAEVIGGGSQLRLNSVIYPIDLVMRTAYWFTDLVYIYLEWESQEKQNLIVTFRGKNNELEMRKLVYDFLNSLIDQAVRKQIEIETHEIREIIVRKAFSEALSRKDQNTVQKYGA